MTIIMKAKEVADTIYTTIASQVKALQQAGVQPHLATILVEGDPASAYYAEAKRKIAEKLGISYRLHELSCSVAEEEILQLIDSLNQDPNVHGIMLELPLPKHLPINRIVGAVAFEKDIDGITPHNKLATITGELGLYPATPQACIRLVKHYGYSLQGEDVTLVGGGQTVGLPLFHMLQREQATVTLCHAGTRDVGFHLQHARFAFVAVGKPDLITANMVHSDLVIVDVGINEKADGGIVGDVAADVRDIVEAISPVPGGVGTLTTAVLFENVLKAIDIQKTR